MNTDTRVAANDEGDEEFDAFLTIKSAPKAADRKRIVRTVSTVPAAFQRLAERIMGDEFGGLATLQSKGNLVIDEDVMPRLCVDEETYKHIRIALRDWLITNGVREAKVDNAGKGRFRLAGSFHDIVQSGDKAGEPHPYPNQIRITLTKS